MGVGLSKTREIRNEGCIGVVVLAVFVELKFAGVVDWSWWWVLSPFLIGLAAIAVKALFNKIFRRAGLPKKNVPGTVDAEDIERVLKISSHTSSLCSEFGIVDNNNRLTHICDEIVRNEDRDGRAYLPVTVMADVLVKAGYTCSREAAVKAYLEAGNRRAEC